MFTIYFGRYLLEKGELTTEQFLLLKENLTDDIKGGEPGGSYDRFVKELLRITGESTEWLESMLQSFKDEKQYLDQDLQALKSYDVEQIVKVFMKVPLFSGMHYSYVASTIRNMIQFVDVDVMIEPVVQLSSLRSVYVVKQDIYGDQQMFTCITADKDEIIDLASTFAEEEFSVVDPFSMDAIAELLNLSNGIFASELSEEGIELDLYPPEMYPEERVITTDGVAFLIPLYISGKRVNVVFSINTDVDIV